MARLPFLRASEDGPRRGWSCAIRLRMASGAGGKPRALARRAIACAAERPEPERMSANKVRAFLAADMPSEVRENVARIQDQLRSTIGSNPVRWVRPDAVHLTLRFLGDIPEPRIAPIVEALGPVARSSAPIVLALGEPGAFPNRQRARVLWVGVQDPTSELRVLAGRLEETLQTLGFPREDRAFRAHLTLGRVRDGSGRTELQGIEKALQEFAPSEGASWSLQTLTLHRSILKPDGPTYSVLGRLILGGGTS
jgi:2'-5' RNA ligase